MHRDLLPSAAKLCGAIALTLSLTACGSDMLSDGASGANPSETTSSIPTSTVAAPQAAEASSLEPAYVSEVFQLTWTSLGDPEAPVDLSQILTDSALEEIDNQRSEWSVNNWHQEGLPTIVSTEIEPGENPETAIAKVCVDSTPVKVLDENSVELNEEEASPEDNRSLMIAVFAQNEGAWKLADQKFPDDPTC